MKHLRFLSIQMMHDVLYNVKETFYENQKFSPETVQPGNHDRVMSSRILLKVH